MVPTTLGLIVSYLFLTMPALTFEPLVPVNHVECFAGARAVTNAWTDNGERAEALDVEYGYKENNINGVVGFLNHVIRFLSVRVILFDITCYMFPEFPYIELPPLPIILQIDCESLKTDEHRQN